MDREENYSVMVRLEHSGRNVRENKTTSGFLGLGGSIAEGSNARLDRPFAINRIELMGTDTSKIALNDLGQGALKLGLYSNWIDGVSLQEHAAACAGLISDTNALLNHVPDPREVVRGDKEKKETIHNFLRQKFGDDAWAALVEYNNVLARDDTAIAHAVLNNTSRMLARNMSVAYLAYNLGTMLKQMTSLPRFIVAAGPHRILYSMGEFLAGVADYASTGQNGFLNEIYDLDPQMRQRGGDATLRAIREDPAWGSTVYQRALDMGLAPISMIDRWVAAIGWKAVYNRGISQGLSVSESARETQRVVLLTQQPTHAKDAPRIWRQQGIARLAMIFTSEAAQMWGMGIYDFAQQVRRFDVYGMLGSVTAATLSAVMMQMITFGLPDDDNDESWAEWVLRAFSRQALDSIPLIGKDMVAAWQRIDGTGYFGPQPTAVAAPFTNLVTGVYGLADDKDTNNERAIWDLIEGVSLLGARFPISETNRIIDAAFSLREGETSEALSRLIGRRNRQEKARRATLMLH
jgi:hypothetical protein